MRNVKLERRGCPNCNVRQMCLYIEDTEGGAEMEVLEAIQVYSLLRKHLHRVEGEADLFEAWWETARIGDAWWFSKGIIACVRDTVHVRRTLK